MRTQTEIDEQLTWLKENRDKVATHGFGFNNREKIDADIAVLEGKLDSDDVWDKTAEEGEEDDSKEWTWEIGESALATVDWLQGKDDTSPKENWGPLVKA